MKNTTSSDTHLADYQWLSSTQAHQAFLALLQSELSKIQIAQFSTDATIRTRRLELLKTQVTLQKSCNDKFPNPADWMWTRKLLEQSSDFWCAQETAKDIPSNSHVLDFCSGAGADAIAIAQAGHQVESFDIDPIAQALLDGNAKRNEVEIQSFCVPAEQATVTATHFLHIDPDRRSGGARVTSSHDFLPAWSSIAPMIERCLGATIKVAPATRLTEEISSPDVIRYLSRNRSVRQQRWLWNQQRWPNGSLVASAFHLGQWHHEVFSQDLLEQFSPYEVTTESLDSFVGDYDPVIRAADASSLLSERMGVEMLGAHGYLTHSEPLAHPMVRWFQVIETLPMDKKKLVALSRRLNARSWELKTRGVEFAIDKLRKELVTDPQSNQELTILFTKVGKKHQAIVAMPVAVHTRDITACS